MIYVTATFRIRPGTIEPFVEAAYVLIDAARQHAGCIYYDLHASVTDPDRLVCIEQWSDRATLQAHFGTPQVAAFTAAVEPFILSSVVEIIHPDQVEIL